MSEYQDTETAQFYDRKMGDSGDAHHRLLLDPPMEALLPAADVDVLDVGSGNGYGTQRLARKYRRVVGIDQSEELVKIASAKRQPGFDIQYRVVDIENDLPLSDKSFGLIFSHMVLHYIRDVDLVAQEFYRVAQDGATVLLSQTHPEYEIRKVPELKGRTGRTNYSRQGLGDSTLLKNLYFEPIEEFGEHFTKAGFTLIRTEDVVFTEDYVSHDPKYRDFVGTPRAAIFVFQKT